MQAPQHKQYFVKTDWTYLQVANWIQCELIAGRLHSTESCTVSLDFISGNDVNEHNAQRWTNMYHFSRTASVTMRYMMLCGTGLLRFHDPDIGPYAKRRNSARIRCTNKTQSVIGINYDGRLASNACEAQWISAHFDMLFPHFHVQNQLESIIPGEVRSLPTNELVVMDTRHHMVWQIIVSLQVTRLMGPYFWLQAVPIVQVNQYELPPGFAQQPVQDPFATLQRQLLASIPCNL